jgi:hypothetical protein
VKVRDALRDEEAKLRRARWERLTRSIEAGWARDCFDPVRHLRAVTGEGDSGVLNAFYQLERFGTPGVISYLARLDMTEVGHAISGSKHLSAELA